MTPYVISFAAGVAVGLFYGLLGVRSPAPPVIALLGLLGVLVGEEATPAALRQLEARPPEIVWQNLDHGNKALGRRPGDAMRG